MREVLNVKCVRLFYSLFFLFFCCCRVTLISNPNREMRRAQTLFMYGFECTCLACVKNYNVKNFSRYEANFIFGGALPKTWKEAAKEFKENCSYIKKNFNLYPSYELFFLLQRNYDLISKFAEKLSWPFDRL